MVSGLRFDRVRVNALRSRFEPPAEQPFGVLRTALAAALSAAYDCVQTTEAVA